MPRRVTIEILQGMDQLKKQYKDLVTLIEYGKSVEGRPLRLMVAMKKNRRFAEHPTLVMSGTTHGNEYLNIEDRLPRALLAKSRQRGNISRFLEEGGAFVFIPILNPDGFESRNRENAHGVDLNRDWDVRAASYQGFKEIETRALADELDSVDRKFNHVIQRTAGDDRIAVIRRSGPLSPSETPSGPAGVSLAVPQREFKELLLGEIEQRAQGAADIDGLFEEQDLFDGLCKVSMEKGLCRRRRESEVNWPSNRFDFTNHYGVCFTRKPGRLVGQSEELVWLSGQHPGSRYRHRRGKD